MTKEQKPEKKQKIAIVGAGISGILVANRLLASSKNCDVTLLDDQTALGGGSCSLDWERKLWSPHPSLISRALHDFIANALLSTHNDSSKPDLEFHPSELNLLVQKQVIKLPPSLAQDTRLPKALGGTSAQKNWKTLWESELFSSPKDESGSLAKMLAPKLKDNLATTLKMLSSWNGTSSWQKASPRAFKERNEYCSSLTVSPSLEKIYLSLLSYEEGKNFSLLLNEKIISSSYENKQWTLKTKESSLKFDKLIVAHSPWEALAWMDRKDIPTSLLKMALKTKPLSLISLTKKIKEGAEDIPPQMIMPAEQSTIRRIDNNLYLSLNLDYESSMDAPSVTKALKALRRSSIKMLKYFPSLVLEGEHIALHPIAWSQSTHYSDIDYINKLSSYNYFSEHLAFCGESYGPSYKPDENIIKSVIACTNHFSSRPKEGIQI